LDSGELGIALRGGEALVAESSFSRYLDDHAGLGLRPRDFVRGN
jgi:hypothetical protein